MRLAKTLASKATVGRATPEFPPRNSGQMKHPKLNPRKARRWLPGNLWLQNFLLRWPTSQKPSCSRPSQEKVPEILF
jgi:hypothetical protein